MNSKSIHWLLISWNFTVFNLSNASISIRTKHEVIIFTCITNPTFFIMTSSTFSNISCIFKRTSDVSTVEARSIIELCIPNKSVFFIALAFKWSVFKWVWNPIVLTGNQSKISSVFKWIAFIGSCFWFIPFKNFFWIVMEWINIVSSFLSTVHCAFLVFRIVENIEREIPISII